MGPWRAIWFPRAEPEQMIRSMDACGVRVLVFCHHEALFCPERGNAANVAAVRRWPDRLRAYVGINPNYPQAIERDLAAFDDCRDVFVGLKLLADYHAVPWDDAAYEPAWRFADDRGLPVLAHTWGGSRFNGAELVRKIAARWPRVRLLMGHSINPYWDEAAAIAAELPNVYLDLCSVTHHRGTLEKFVAAGLTRKMLFGTDLPWFDPHADIGSVLSADITDEDRHDILHRNARRLFADAGVPLP